MTITVAKIYCGAKCIDKIHRGECSSYYMGCIHRSLQYSIKITLRIFHNLEILTSFIVPFYNAPKRTVKQHISQSSWLPLLIGCELWIFKETLDSVGWAWCPFLQGSKSVLFQSFAFHLITDGGRVNGLVLEALLFQQL